jgi:hypothetical protein
MRYERSVARAAWLSGSLLLASCVSSQLDVPANHPGHASARSGVLPSFHPLHSESDALEESSSQSPQHDHDAGASTPAVRYTCPMHPEVVKDAPGRCPLCGMQLVPKKEQK